MSRVGKVRKLADDEAGFVLRWTVDGFLGRLQKGCFASPDFHFRSVNFHLSIPPSLGSEKKVYLRWSPYGLPPPLPFSWKLSVEGGDGRILLWAEGVELKMFVCGFNLGSLQNVERLLHPDGSLVLFFELRPILEGTSTNTSTYLQHPAEDVVKKSAGEIKNRNATNGAGKSGLAETSAKECDEHLSTRTFGALQQDVPRTRGTWMVPNFRELTERETWNVIRSERFHFGSRLWQLRLSRQRGHVLEDPKEGQVLLSLEDVGECQTYRPFWWRIWMEDGDGAILHSNGGVCEDAYGARDLTLPLGPLRDVRRFLDSEGAFRAAYELRLPKETADASSQAESGVGTDVLARDLERLLSSGDASDATVRVKGHKDFPVHRNILGARTPVFSSMFRHQMSEKASGVVDIEDCEPDTFGHFLHYVYTGRVEDLRPENAIPLYQVADKYQVEELKLECLEHIRGDLSIESFCPTLTLALTYSEKELTQLATDFFVDNAKEITLTVEWQRFVCENPIQANELIVKVFQNTQGKTTLSKKLNR